MSRAFCLDSSVIVKWLVADEETQQARALFHQVTASRGYIILPSLAWAEVGSTLRKKTHQGLVEPSEAARLWSAFRGLPNVRFVDDDAIADRSWAIAARFGLNTLYDATFLAVAELVTEDTGDPCEYWTADEVLVKQLAGRVPCVRSLSSLSGAMTDI